MRPRYDEACSLEKKHVLKSYLLITIMMTSKITAANNTIPMGISISEKNNNKAFEKKLKIFLPTTI